MNYYKIIKTIILVFIALVFINARPYPKRVQQAYIEKSPSIKNRLKSLGMTDFNKIFLRHFKHEGVLEIWIGKHKQPLKLYQSFPLCAQSGLLGPKNKRGDLQVPEGVYHINRFNPWSNYHLSLGLNYPNAVDRKRSKANNLGGDIFIHGSCVTIGCLPMTDETIKEIYVLLDMYRKKNIAKIPVHIFPFNYSTISPEKYSELITIYPQWVKFWETLKPIYLKFENEKIIPKIKIVRNKYNIDK